MTNIPETLILRFRDLVTADGGTIDEHCKMIQEKGYVWWGWWNKLGEKVPYETFAKLNAKAKCSCLNIYLMDSGRSLLYKAVCSRIKYGDCEEKISTPETDCTPAYYNEQQYLAWFKLDSLEQTPIEENSLKEFTYVQVDDFFMETPSRYTPFYNKIVHSIRELRQQDRTIWFVRKAVAGEDKEFEVSLLDAKKFTPEDFTKDFIRSSSPNLLWVSDLHFSTEGHHAFPLTPDGAASKTIGNAIDKALRDKDISDIAGILISGDITWKATKEEYTLAKSFLAWTSSWKIHENYQIALCPGNHDVAFSNKPLEQGSEARAASDEARREYESFYQHLFYIKPNQYLCSGRKFLINEVVPVEIVCLNTSYLEQGSVQAGDGKTTLSHFKGQGFVGDEQLHYAEKSMGWDQDSDDKPKAYRIVIMHHHILPLTYRELPEVGLVPSSTLDAGAITDWITKHRINLVLHGHMHQPFCAKIARPLGNDWGRWPHEFHVVAMGSTGVNGHLGEVGKNTFGILRFGKSSLKIIVYSIDKLNPSEQIAEIEIPYEIG